jgi:anti-sigma factor RsiW
MDHSQALSTLATERYLLGEMTEQERDAFEEHYFDCGECAEDVRAGALMTDGARAGLIGPAKVVQLGPRPIPRRVVRLGGALPWAVAATLAVVVGYQSLARGPAVSVGTGAVALQPVTLRPASRGDEAVVTLVQGAGVTLAVDLGGVDVSRTSTFALQKADGTTVAAGTFPPPAPGSPLLLFLPANLLTPSAHYVLQVGDSQGQGSTSATYRLTVAAR